MKSEPWKNLEPIGYLETCFDQRFAVPRQSGLAPSAEGRLELSHADRDSVRGLEDFSHVILIWCFDRNKSEKSRSIVRPPRLGGNAGLGVFATRSPYRPNPLGLSVVTLLDVEASSPPVLRVGGVDLVNGTAILDVKPYVPWADSIADATCGFAPEPTDFKDVEFAPGLEVSVGLRKVLSESLRWDPRPSWHRRNWPQGDPSRSFHVEISGWTVSWRVADGKVLVEALVTQATN